MIISLSTSTALFTNGKDCFNPEKDTKTEKDTTNKDAAATTKPEDQSASVDYLTFNAKGIAANQTCIT